MPSGNVIYIFFFNNTDQLYFQLHRSKECIFALKALGKKMSLMIPAKSKGQSLQSWYAERDQRKPSMQTSNTGSRCRQNCWAEPALSCGGTLPLVPKTSLVHSSTGMVTRLHGFSTDPTSNFSWGWCSETDAKSLAVGMNGIRCFFRRCLQSNFNYWPPSSFLLFHLPLLLLMRDPKHS